MNTPMETASNAVHTFDPDRVAALETRSWRQYYDRDWLGMFRTLVALHREQFSLSHLGALLATLSASRAARTFAPLESSDPDRARQQLVPYYRRARVALGSAASAETLAAREVDYWIVHRRLAIQRKANPAAADPDALDDIQPMVDAFARLHAALFNSTPADTRPSAEYRALAAKAVDRITGGYSDDIPADWARTEDYLRRAYRAVAAVVEARPIRPQAEVTP
ncbi:MAG TPA: hypothetical protein PK829_08690 [Promineifilum sp.]|nr:hypothetical protein [Promineifilum sp.]